MTNPEKAHTYFFGPDESRNPYSVDSEDLQFIEVRKRPLRVAAVSKHL